MKNIYQMEVVTCFHCEGQPGHYLEFLRSGTNAEKILCPSCRSNQYTVPNNYMNKMGLKDLDNLFHVMAAVTRIRPLHDLAFKSLRLPNCIIIQRGAAS